MQGLENNTFDVGASSNPAKFSKSLKNIENFIQKTYKDPDDMVKTIQKDGVVHDNDLTKNNEKLKNIQIVSNSNIFLANGIKHTKQPKRTSLLFL